MIAGHLALGSLEWSYPPSDVAPSQADAIVVLAGNFHAEGRDRTKLRLGGETIFRCLQALQLYRAAGCRIIVSGGTLSSSKPGMSMAAAMRDFFVLLGVPATDITLEDQSKTTFENGLRNTTAILAAEPAKRVFLVTSASHMRRAERCFAKQGTVVIPAPCNHQAVRLELGPTSFLPSVEGIRGVQAALHEWLGLTWYWLRGRI